jgi:hypothetical protein
MEESHKQLWDLKIFNYLVSNLKEGWDEQKELIFTLSLLCLTLFASNHHLHDWLMENNVLELYLEVLPADWVKIPKNHYLVLVGLCNLAGNPKYTQAVRKLNIEALVEAFVQKLPIQQGIMAVREYIENTDAVWGSVFPFSNLIYSPFPPIRKLGLILTQDLSSRPSESLLLQEAPELVSQLVLNMWRPEPDRTFAKEALIDLSKTLDNFERPIPSLRDLCLFSIQRSDLSHDWVMQLPEDILLQYPHIWVHKVPSETEVPSQPV